MLTVRAAGLWLSAIVCATYVLCGQVVRDAYPFSSFAMYARATPSATRIVAKSADGAVFEVDAYTAWQCTAFTLADCVTPEDGTVAYRDREALRSIRETSTTGRERAQVLLIRRSYKFTSQTEIRDCVMARCTAARR